MKRSDMQISRPRWRALGSTAVAVAAVAVIGFTSVTPAKADWRRDGWYDRGGAVFFDI